MSLLDELQEEADKRNPLRKKRSQIERLRKQAKEAFNAQFLLDANKEIIARLQGRIEAFDECLELFKRER